MRELTKSIFGFSWAMSLFGIQQTTNLTSPDKAVKALNAVTEATQAQFTEVLKSTFHAGDKLQRNAVDMTLGMMSGEALNPNKWMRLASDAAKQSSEAVTKGLDGFTSTVRQAAWFAIAPGSGGANAGVGRGAPDQGWG